MPSGTAFAQHEGSSRAGRGMQASAIEAGRILPGGYSTSRATYRCSRASSWSGASNGLRRIGNVLVNSPLHKRSIVLRYTAGLNVVFDGSVRLKLSGEYYDFSDFDDELAGNLGVVAAF
jgi:hypothetical protein